MNKPLIDRMAEALEEARRLYSEPCLIDEVLANETEIDAVLAEYRQQAQPSPSLDPARVEALARDAWRDYKSQHHSNFIAIVSYAIRAALAEAGTDTARLQQVLGEAQLKLIELQPKGRFFCDTPLGRKINEVLKPDKRISAELAAKEGAK